MFREAFARHGVLESDSWKPTIVVNILLIMVNMNGYYMVNHG